MATIVLQSKDGKLFPVDILAAKMSPVVTKMLMDIHIDKNGGVHEIIDPIPLPNVDSQVLKKVLEWCKEKYKTEENPQQKKKGQGAAKNSEETKDREIYEVKGWDKEFIDSINSVDEDGKSMLFDVSIAANDLKIQSLVDITTMEIARLMKDKKEEDIRDLFKLTHPDAKPKGSSKKITLQSGDGKDFLVDVEAAKMSVTIRTMLDDLGIESSSVDDEIKDILPIPNCNAAVLEKVILWCEHHKDDVEPEKKVPESKAVNVASKDPYELEGFDYEYIKAVNHVSTIGQSLIFDLIIAANYLNIPGLNDLCITEVANMLRGKSQEEIRYVFNLKNDKLIGEDDTYE